MTITGDSCTLYWHASFLCEGDPTSPDSVPTVKAEYIEGDYEPGTTGWVHMCFYSVAAPTSHGTYADGLAVKYGVSDFGTGDLVGVLPSCDTGYSATESSTWGE